MPSARVVMLSVAALLSIAGPLAYARMQSARPPVSPDIARSVEAPRPTASPAASAAKQDFLGVVLARMTADVAPRFEGRLREVHVRLGDRVLAGAPIATLDAPSLKFDQRVAEASMQAATVELERTSVELAESEERLKRRSALSAEALVSSEDLAQAKYQQKLAQARSQATREQLAERRAQVDKLRQDNADSVVRAPFSGIVAARYIDPGNNVSPLTPILRLISADDLFVRFAVPEAPAAALRAGQAVTVRIRERDVEVCGSITKIAPEVDAASRMVFVEAQLCNVEPAVRVLSGEIARVSIDGAP